MRLNQAGGPLYLFVSTHDLFSKNLQHDALDRHSQFDIGIEIYTRRRCESKPGSPSLALSPAGPSISC
jgi:hypothetical protein